jgi:hypothetical protein
MKNLKKEIQNLKDSNENHIFINEKLNSALKKANIRAEELEKQYQESAKQKPHQEVEPKSQDENAPSTIPQQVISSFKPSG